MSEMHWTGPQKQAIEAEGGRLLVSAAAGSGKTAVLVERICSRITDPERNADIDRFLIVTFTKAAAQGMRNRIVTAIYERLADHPDDIHLERQLSLVGKASIDTISAFCLTLLRRYFHKLELSPDFRIAEESEMVLLKVDVLDRKMEEWYAGTRAEEFAMAASFFSKGKTDSTFAEILAMLETKTASMPDPMEYLRLQQARYETAIKEEPLETLWGKVLQERAKLRMEYVKERLEEAMGLCEIPDLESKTLPILMDDAAYAKALLAKIKEGNWEEIREVLQSREAMRFTSPKGYEDKALINYLKQARDLLKETVGSLLADFHISKEEMKADFETLAKPIAVVCDFVMDYLTALEIEKKERGILDFPDIEHFVYRLLVNHYDVETGELQTTPLAKEIAAEYDEIYIDEYQDINELQDIIFRAVSHEEKNIFLVGDVKQSIYRFRHSDPTIFLRKKQEGSVYGEEQDPPYRIELSSNFRSREPILSAANYFFHMVMSERFGEMEYTEREFLRFGAASYEGESLPVEVDFCKYYKKGSEYLPEGVEPESKIAGEAAFVAKRIKELFNSGKMVTDEKTGLLRPIRPGDIVLLMRSIARRAPIYEDALRAESIPTLSDGGEQFFSREEISAVLSLLQAIDNPAQDIPLIAAMRSGLFEFKSDELAAMRAEHLSGDFWDAVKAYAEKDEKTKAFVEKVNEYRLIAKNIPVGDLLLKIYEETDFELIAAAMPEGELRRQNLRLLYDYARAFEKSSYQGLFQFNRFIDRLSESERDFASAKLLPEGFDAVRIMTIHKSKGLEFPVVFVCDCSHRFNANDQKGSFLLHQKLGFGPKVRDLERRLEFDSMPRKVIAARMREDSLAEELRTFYVALTRAKEHLFLVGTVEVNKDGLSGLKQTMLSEKGHLHPELMKDYDHYTGWLMAVLQHHPDGGALRDELGTSGENILDGPHMNIRILEPEYLDLTEEEKKEEKTPPAEAEKYAKEIADRLEYQYPYLEAVEIPTKLSVSDLISVEDDKEETKTKTLFQVPEQFGQKQPTGADRGNALHHFMQFAELTKLTTHEDAKEELKNLVDKEFLSEREGNLISIRQVVEFTKSDLFARMRKAIYLLREYRFNLAFSAEDFVAAGIEEERFCKLPEGEFVLIQGVIDGAFLTDHGYVIFDFKTDAATDEQVLRKRYETQLALYARAVEMMSKTPVCEKVIYSFSLGKEIKL